MGRRDKNQHNYEKKSARIVMFQAADHTFVICAYKENPYLEETIFSLKNQSIKSEIMLSTSTPNEHIQKLCRTYDIKMMVNGVPRLAGDDWNYAYSCADTPLITLAHQDDFYETNFLSETLKAANEAQDDISLLFTDYYEIRNRERVEDNRLLSIKRFMNTPLRFRVFNKSVFVKKRTLAFGCSICCPSVTLNRKIAGEAIFDTTYRNSCDYKTWVNLAMKQGRFVYVPKKLIGHRIYAESATSRNLSENVRKKEDLEILSELWPVPFAKVINHIYASSEKSNIIDD